MDHRRILTGEFARLTDVSVRALRFYDKVGLLTPAGRTEAGYRWYGRDDLTRLEQILALKFLGFSLSEIKSMLIERSADPRAALARQRAMLRERRDQIDAVLRAIERAERTLDRSNGAGADWDAVVAVIRAIQMDQTNDWRKTYFSDEELDTIERLRDQAYSDEAKAARPAWTEADQRAVDARYDAHWDGVRQAVAAGRDPADPEAQALAAEASALLDAFTGGNPAVAEGLQTWWDAYAELPADRRPPMIPLSDEESTFLERAKEIYRARR